MIVQHNHKHDKMAQVQLDEVQMSRLQMNMFSWVLVLIVQSGKKVKFTRTIHVLLLLQYCQALLECCTACYSIASSSLLLMLTWLMQVVVLSKKKNGPSQNGSLQSNCWEYIWPPAAVTRNLRTSFPQAFPLSSF